MNALIISVLAFFDPTQGGLYAGYPTYSDYKCGTVTTTVVEQRESDAMVRATTTCSTGGRGTKPLVRLACTHVAFDAAGVIVPNEYGEVGERVLTASWRLGSPAVACPVLP